MASPTRWGILSVGRISNDFALCLNTMPDTEHQIVAVAARNRDRAEKFAADFGIPHVHDTYEGVMNDPDVDTVYIATIQINHVELSLACIEAGKNVVCEKPMSLSLEGCQKVLEAAKRKGVLFVEGFWTRFFPATKFIREQVESGELGEVRSAQLTFCFPMWGKERISRKDQGGGGLMDIGSYTAMWANLIFKGKPESVTAQGTVSDEGVDKQGFITLRYPGDKFVTIVYDTMSMDGANSVHIRGTKANIVIPDLMWCPDRLQLQDGTTKIFQLPAVKKEESLIHVNSQGFIYEIQGVRDALLKGLKECPEIPHEDSENIKYILTEVQKQLGVSFDFQ